jgi:anti-sigma B factor antagonist
MLVLDVDERAGWHVLVVAGDLDVVTAPQVRSEIVSLISDGASDLVIDLTRVDLLDSFGLGVLVGALKRIKQHNGRLVLAITEPRVLKMLALTGLDAVFEVVDSVDLAVAS